MPKPLPRLNLVSAFLMLLPLFVSCSHPSANLPEPVPLEPVKQRPAWLKQGIVMAGNWETLSHLLRSGQATSDQVAEYKAERSEAVARKLKEAGITLVTTSFYKGMGLRTEADEFAMARQFVAAGHSQGLKMGGYVGGTLFYETLEGEESDARNWRQVNEWGYPIYYGDEQTYRVAPCRNNPHYQAFVQKVLRGGVQELKLDLIHFDQMSWWPEPSSCRCPYCREQFRQFLRQRYSDEQLKLRFSFTRLEGVVPPPFNHWEGPLPWPELSNPLMQDWAMFRAASLSRRFGEYDNYIRKLNPQVAVDGNPFFDQTANNGFQSGTTIDQYLQYGDVMWTEDGHHASWTADGRLISKIRTFKQARLMGKSVFMYTGGGMWGIHDPLSPPQLRLAEALAYNDMNLGMVGHVTPEGVDLTPAARNYISFFHAHAKDLVDTESVADAALLRSFASVEFNPGKALLSSFLFEQTLIQTKIPFAIISDRRLNDLGKYKVLILANQDALSDEQLSAIREFVRNGGGLVATEETSWRDGWRRERGRFGLADLLGMDRPGQTAHRSFGKGRVAYLPRIQPATTPPPATLSYYLGDEHWKLPVNYAELADAVKWAAGGELTATVEAPLSVTAELARQPSTNTWLLHLVNYNYTKPVNGISVSLRLPVGRRVREATLQTPDGGSPQVLRVEPAGAALSFKVPRLEVYDLILLRLEG